METKATNDHVGNILLVSRYCLSQSLRTSVTCAQLHYEKKKCKKCSYTWLFCMTALKIIKIRLEYTLYVYSIPTDLLLFFYDNVMQLGVYELKILSDF